MRTVEDQAGERFLLLDTSGDTWLVRQPGTALTHRRPAEAFTVLEDVSPLETVARSVPDTLREDLALPNERAVGLLAEIHAREPVGVRDLLAYDLCESDLHGFLAEFTAGGLLEETRVVGERGYETSDRVAARLDTRT